MRVVFTAVQAVTLQSYDNVCSPQQLSPLQRISNFSSPRSELDRSKDSVRPLVRAEAKWDAAPALSVLPLKLLGKRQIDGVLVTDEANR